MLSNASKTLVIQRFNHSSTLRWVTKIQKAEKMFYFLRFLYHFLVFSRFLWFFYEVFFIVICAL